MAKANNRTEIAPEYEIMLYPELNGVYVEIYNPANGHVIDVLPPKGVFKTREEANEAIAKHKRKS